MYNEECVPYAPALIESMRSLGYSFPSAIADLIDNSISAHAGNIGIFSNPSNNPFLIILDDGDGMDEREIYEAMRYGSTNPLEERNRDDLGRFGLGMKSASLSQCRRFAVASRRNGGEVHAFSWDLDYVISSGKWMLKGYTAEEIRNFPMISLLYGKKSGTYIILEDFDRIRESTNQFDTTFSRCLDDMIEHLSLVFHRYIDDGLNISVNGMRIEAKDPFLSYHPATQRKRESTIYMKSANGEREEKITLKPFILPHASKLSQADLDKVGGKERMRSDQGFYVYRNRRLIVWGTWFRLEHKDELNKLARVMVDIPNSLDYLWSIDIKKSTAYLPDSVKKNMYAAVYEAVQSSERVYTYRGRNENKNKDIEYVWDKIKVRDGYKYQINRKLPQLSLLESKMDHEELKLLDALLDAIESAFPSQALYADMAKGRIKEDVSKEDEATAKILTDLQTQIDYVTREGLPVRQFYKLFLKSEPYCNYPVVVERIKEELSKNE